MGWDEKIIKIGVNGAGGVGFQIIINLLLQGNNMAKLVAINEPSISTKYMAPLFNSLCPRDLQHVFEANNENTLHFGQNSVKVLSIRNPADIPWAAMGVEYVIESTGMFTVKDKAAAHFKGGAKKVIITDISKDVPIYVFGVNEKDYKPEDDIVSSASLITHHLAPILAVFHEKFRILSGDMKILDSAIDPQPNDGPSTVENMDRRTALFNPIPIVTSGANAIGKILRAFDRSVGIGGDFMPALNTISSIADALNAVGEFLQAIGNSLGLDDGLMITLRKLLSAPAAMNTIDGPCGASSSGIVPADVEAVGKVLADLYGKLTGTVSPGLTMDGSIVDLTVGLEEEATLDVIKAAIKSPIHARDLFGEESEGKFKEILGYTEGDRSRHLDGDRRSSIFNAVPTACSALDDNHFNFIFRCDNQWGYGCRVIDLILYMDSVKSSNLN